MGFIDTLRGLSLQRQIMLGVTVLGVMAAMTFLVRGTLQPSMSLLYSGLDPVRAGEVINELESLDVPYEIRGEAIFIPGNVRDRTRFALARDGLPRQSIQGYELLDSVNGFSVTSEMYNAAYWRAKEGELTRTILTTPGVDSARVHIGANLRSGFSRAQPTPTASVTLSSARRLNQGQAEAIQYLVALAVSGLNPEDVVVIDPRHGILAGPTADVAEAPSIVAEDQASALEQKIKRLLSARLGEGNAEVSVSIDVSRERTVISDVRFDPESRVVRSRTTNDSNETNQGGGNLTVASNLPQGDAAGGQNESTSKSSTESVAYELNETRTQTERLPGQIERVSIAVLLNQEALGIDLAAADAATQIEQARANFEALVQNAAGLDAERGDTLTVELMPFQPLPEVEMTPAPSVFERLIEQHLWSAVQAIFLGVIVLALGFGVMRPMFAQGAAGAEDGDPDTAGDGATEGGVDGDLFEQASDPIDYLKDYTSENQEQTAALLQDWLKEDRKIAANE